MKCYMATFQPAYRTTELVFPTQVRVYAATRKEAQQKARLKVGGIKEQWRVARMRLKEIPH